jgi:hypothetical protein
MSVLRQAAAFLRQAAAATVTLSTRYRRGPSHSITHFKRSLIYVVRRWSADLVNETNYFMSKDRWCRFRACSSNRVQIASADGAALDPH